MGEAEKMQEFGIIDFHTHLFPDRIAEGALKKISGEIGLDGGALYSDATAGGTERVLSPLGIKRAVVCNIAVSPEREEAVNDFAISLLKNPFFIPLGSIHPKSKNKGGEAERLYAAGIKGVKLHPDFMKVPLSDEGYGEIFSLLSRLGMFLLIHSGYNPFRKERALSSPEKIAKIKDKYGSLKIVAAHLGGFGMAERALFSLSGSGVYLDTSLSSLRGSESLYNIIEAFGEDYVLFGTDTPWSSPARELDFIKKSPLSDSRKEKILRSNALKLIL